MAIITISRQIASFGDEIAEAIAEQLGYTFVTRKKLEADLLKHGLSEEKLSKYDEKKARSLMEESDSNRDGFHKCFFNTDHDDPRSYDLVVNTDRIDAVLGSTIIRDACSITVSEQEASRGVARVGELLEAQKIVNHIVFDLEIPVHFLEATVNGNVITLHGVADSSAVIERVLDVARSLVPDKEVTSGISLVHDYKSYP